MVIGTVEKLAACDRPDERRLALVLLEKLCDRFPERIAFHLEYARLLQLDGAGTRAREVWRELLRRDPGLVEARFNLAKSLVENGDETGAARQYQILLERYPDYCDALFNLANLRQCQGDHAGATELYQKLLRYRPEWTEAWINLAAVYHRQRQDNLSRACLEKALLIEPDNVLAHWNLGQLLLLAGDWEAGWREFEWRCRREQAFKPECTLELPEWQGENLEGRRLLLWSEQ